MLIAVRCEGIVPGSSCGVENFTCSLLSALSDIGQDQLVVTIPRGTSEAWKSRVAPTDRLQYREVLATASINASRTARRTRALSGGRRLLRRSRLARGVVRRGRIGLIERDVASVRPDVVYYPFHLADVSGSRAIVTVHDLRSHHETLGNDVDRAAVGRNIALAQAVVTSWPHPYAEIEARYPECTDRLSMIPFPPMIAPTTTGAAQRSDRLAFLYPSATASHKNHVALIEALAIVRRSFDVELICTGAKVDPGYQAAFRRAVELGLESSVTFTGFIEATELETRFRSCDAVVVPTLWEAASGAVFEAFAYEKPVACSDIPPLRSQVELADAKVRFFDPNDREDIARAICDVARDPARFAAGSRRARQWLETLSWKRTAAAYRSVFQAVALAALPRVRGAA